MHSRPSSLQFLVCTALVSGAACTPALAQLAPKNVLVVYDSLIADSRLIAEHYAGSAAITGSTEKKTGTRPGAPSPSISQSS